MELSGVSAPILPVQSEPIVQPQPVSEPSEVEPEVTVEEEGGGKAKGVVRKLNEGDHFKGVANVRLRIAHFDNPDLEPIDPEDLPNPEDVSGKAYEKFLGQYRALYEASQVAITPVVPEPEPIEEPVAEAPLVPEESPVAGEPANEIPVIEPIIVPPLELEPIAVPEQIEPEVPVDEDEGALAALEESLDALASEEEPETLDIVM